MPNWVTNNITASPAVITAMLNSEGRIDFDNMAPFPGEHNWDGISMAAEEAAEAVLGVPVACNPLLAMLQTDSRSKIDIKAMRDDCFEQFVGMLRNHRKCGYLHSMDFARKVWGTKWNACDQSHDVAQGTATFETAWSCPEGVLVELSKRFPEEEIAIEFADEDIGSNCGSFTLKGGASIASDIAPAWRDQTDEMKAKWKAFAHKVRGSDPADYEDDE